MPGSNIYGSTNSAASRSRAEGKGGLKNVKVPNAFSSTGSGAENNNSIRSTGSGSTSGSARKFQRSSFRRTRMFQKNKRNNSSNNSDTDETSLIAKSHISVVSQTTPAASDPSPTSKLTNNGFPIINRRAFRGNVGRAVAPSTLEERESGADSPTFPPPRPAKKISNEGSSSSSSFSAHPPKQTRNQLPQEKITEEDAEIPQGHVDNILRFYGGDNMSAASLDLYRDVLKVSPDASDREIRIAYFRRGREILGDSGEKPDQSYAAAKANTAKLDDATKSRFQAVSMAYEILSTPSWKETYMQQGLKSRVCRASNKTSNQVPQVNATITRMVAAKPSDVDPFSSPPSTVAAAFPNARGSDVGKLQKNEPDKPPIAPKPKSDVAQRRRNQRQMLQKLPTALRKSSFTKDQNGALAPRSTISPIPRSSPSVRWKDHVEELVFANHPNEHASDSDSEYSDDFEDDDICDEENNRSDTFQYSLTSNTKKKRDQFSGPSLKSNVDSSRRRRKNKPRIVIDSEELESHLQRMDNEAEKHFVQDFWDNFEESMDGILSLVDSMGGGETPSSWLSPSPPSNPSKRQSLSKGSRDAKDATIGRSLSHDSVIPSKKKVVVDFNNEDFVNRSNSFPLTRSSSLTLDAVSPSPQPSNFTSFGSNVVSPTAKGATAAKTSSDARVSSPFESVTRSLSFQSIKSRDENDFQQEKTQQKLSPVRVVTTPVIVSPSPKSRSKKTSVKSKNGVVDQDATMSVASTIFSTSQPQQSLFRPISPCASEASKVATSVVLSAPAASQMDKPGTGDTGAEYDEFDMHSRLSGMESVDLADLENPFRSKGSSSSTTGLAKASQPKTSTNTDVSDVPVNSNDSSGKSQKKKKRFKISMTSKIKGSSTETEISSCSGASKSDQSMEDVFAGVEEDSPLEKYDMEDGDNAKVPNISIKRSSSHMSDLSESVYSSRRENDVGGEASVSNVSKSKPSDENPASESVTVILDASSVLSASTKKSLAGRSRGGTAYSSYASSTRGDTNSVHSVDSKDMEAAGFFEHFMAYVGAVMTECANVSTSAEVAEYHQDFLTLFSNDAATDDDADTTEVREPPTSTRQPSLSTNSTASC